MSEKKTERYSEGAPTIADSLSYGTGCLLILIGILKAAKAVMEEPSASLVTPGNDQLLYVGLGIGLIYIVRTCRHIRALRNH